MCNTENLLIDDSSQLQINIKSEKERNDIDIIFPSSSNNLEEIWRSFNFQDVVIDFNLSDEWQIPIKLGNRECRNGIDIARQIILKHSETQIGMYSTYMSNLKDELDQNKELDKKIHLIEFDSTRNRSKRIIDFFTATQKIFIKPLYNKNINLPISIQVALNKYISEPRNKGEYLLKIGNYLWQTSINQGMSNKFSKIIANLEKNFYTENNDIIKYIADLDKTDFYLKGLSHNGKFVNLNDLLVERKSHSLPYNLNQYLFIKNKCEEYISKKIKEKDLIHFLSSPFICYEYKLECQSILFKRFKNREKQLKLPEFPFIQDIFKGRVDKVVNDDAYIILQNLLNKSKMKIIKVDTDYLKSNHLEEDSLFEYCLYKNAIGDIVPHIEPYIIY